MTRWRVTQEQWKNWQHVRPCSSTPPSEHDCSARALADAPWTIVEGATSAIAASPSQRAFAMRSAAPRRAACRRLTESNVRDTSEEAARDGVREGTPDCSDRPPTFLSKLDMTGARRPRRSRRGWNAFRDGSTLLHRKAQRAGRLGDPRVRRLGRGGQRAARSAASPPPSTRAPIRSSRSPRRPTKSARTTICGASGGTSPGAAA